MVIDDTATKTPEELVNQINTALLLIQRRIDRIVQALKQHGINI